MLLRHLPSGDRLGSVEDRIQSPEIPEAHNLPKVLLGCQKGCCHPALDHATIPPTTNPPGAHANAGMRTLDDVRGGQAPVQRHRDVQPVDGETLFQSFHQAGSADGYSRSSHSASFFSRAMPPLASSRHAARIADFTWSFSSSGRAAGPSPSCVGLHSMVRPAPRSLRPPGNRSSRGHRGTDR